MHDKTRLHQMKARTNFCHGVVNVSRSPLPAANHGVRFRFLFPVYFPDTLLFLFLFFLSPIIYSYVSISQTDKRTDYPGKEIAIKTQYAWDQQFNTKINVVYGNEWNAGNLSYHLKSRPVWGGFIEREKLDQLKDYMCLDSVCVGSK